jgi:2-succinyl-5-enolpyruvyl-6-hydroxy-3-cyclohexene-1-carboxylate synthase
MGDDEEIHLHVTYASHVDMDEAFCACMRIAIAAGLENAPTCVITTPGTKKPKHMPTEHCPLVPSPGAMDF